MAAIDRRASGGRSDYNKTDSNRQSGQALSLFPRDGKGKINCGAAQNQLCPSPEKLAAGTTVIYRTAVICK